MKKGVGRDKFRGEEWVEKTTDEEIREKHLLDKTTQDKSSMYMGKMLPKHEVVYADLSSSSVQSMGKSAMKDLITITTNQLKPMNQGSGSRLCTIARHDPFRVMPTATDINIS